MYRMYLKSACSAVSEHYKFDKFCDLIKYIKNPTEDNWWLGGIYSVHIISDDTDNEIVLCYDKDTKRMYHFLGNKKWKLMSTNIATLKKYADKVMKGEQL